MPQRRYYDMCTEGPASEVTFSPSQPMGDNGKRNEQIRKWKEEITHRVSQLAQGCNEEDASYALNRLTTLTTSGNRTNRIVLREYAMSCIPEDRPDLWELIGEQISGAFDEEYVVTFEE